MTSLKKWSRILTLIIKKSQTSIILKLSRMSWSSVTIFQMVSTSSMTALRPLKTVWKTFLREQTLSMTQWVDFTRVQRHSQRVRTVSRQELRPHMTAQKTCQRVQDLHTAVQRALQMVLTASKSMLTSFLTRCSQLILTIWQCSWKRATTFV